MYSKGPEFTAFEAFNRRIAIKLLPTRSGDSKDPDSTLPFTDF